MPVLDSQQRKALEDACTKGRRASEQAVRAALTALAVTADRPPAHLDEAERQLRRGLRAKSRQLGDADASYELLAGECAYEQWHRLLFARFLAENNLLIHPEYQAPVTLEDCEELADSLGEPDGWSVAARFAAEILPGIFRPDDPCVRLRLAPEGRLALELIVAELSAEVFPADDALGWVYQFWQKDRKDEVNSAERKIDAADLGPVTQLFTENYMVRFLLDNTLGAWWAARYPASPLVRTFAYLRLEEDGRPSVAAFDQWPKRASEITVIDPCCGSGHFLVEAFSMLWQMRSEEEGLGPEAAQDAVLRDNLFGLELDPRCVQIAMFSLALQSWKAAGSWRELPVPNIACSGLVARGSLDDWRQAAGDDPQTASALTRLHAAFRSADTLGSLIDPRGLATAVDIRSGQQSLEGADWEAALASLEGAIGEEEPDPASAVLGSSLAGIARAARLLSKRYTLVATNVPYLGRGKQSARLRSHIETHYSVASLDLAGAMMMRCLQMAEPGGGVATVSPQTWTYLSWWRSFREYLLAQTRLNLIAKLGARAFEGISGEVVQVVLSLAIHAPPTSDQSILIADFSDKLGPVEKARALQESEFQVSSLRTQRSHVESRLLVDSGFGSPLQEYASVYAGSKPGQTPRVVRRFWEVDATDPRWLRMSSVPDQRGPFSGKSLVILHPDEMRRVGVTEFDTVGGDARGRRGVLVAKMGNLPVSLYDGSYYDDNTYTIIPLKSSDLPALWAWARSDDFRKAIRSISQKTAVPVGAVAAASIDIDHWRGIASADSVPDPHSEDPTQWLFQGQPDASLEPLQVAVARLLGYRWPEQLEPDGLDALSDADGIVCLPSVAGEPPAADRVQQILASAFRDSWSTAKLRAMLEATGSRKPQLDIWLRDDFFKQHCALFDNRPFIWHIWDGQRDGFAALVNYHRLDRKTLEKLTYTYLGDWIERQRAEAREEKAGAEARLAAALKLRGSLELILEGEPPYDIYVRWKSLEEQPIGWEPDRDDGVRLNIRPFVEAGVLRSSFNVHWKKDRGKNPDGSERLNDLHFTAAEKRAARGGA